MLVNPSNGMRVQGWEAETINGESFINTASDTKALFIPVGSKDPANATQMVELACNLDKRTPEVLPGAGEGDIRRGTWTIDKDIYDNFGNVHKLNINFSKVAGTANQWNVNVVVDPDAETATNTTLDIGAENNADGNFIMEFDNLGALTAAFDAQGDRVEAGELLIPVSFDVADSTTGDDGALLRQTFNLNLGDVGSYTNTVTQFAETSSTKAFRQDGYSMGYLETFQIDSRGQITGVYSNGTNRALGQVALASFVNPGGLEKGGESTFMETINSGEANIGPSGIAGKGKFVSGALEMSNVDLAETVYRYDCDSERISGQQQVHNHQ